MKTKNNLDQSTSIKYIRHLSTEVLQVNILIGAVYGAEYVSIETPYALVVRKVVSGIGTGIRIHCYPVNKINQAIYLKVMYPVNSVTHLSNN